MRHNVDIFIGALRGIAMEAVNYIADGNPQTWPFIHAFNLQKNRESTGEIFVESYKFAGVPEEQAGGVGRASAQKESSITGSVEEIRKFLDKIYRDNLTIANPGDSNCMILNAMVPGHDAEAQELCGMLAKAAKESEYRFDFNVIVIRESILRDVLQQEDAKDDKASALWIERLVKDKTECGLVNHIMPLANQNSSGISVNFSEESLSRLLGEFILLCTECYGQVFPSAMDTTADTPIVALGLSTLFFNRNYFVDYLRNSAILRAIEKEGAGSEKVDVNVASNVAQEYLTKQKKRLEDFWDKKVQPSIISGLGHEKIAADISEEIDALFKSMNNDLDAILYSSEYSLTEKQAILARIISEDDALIRGSLYRKDQIAMESFENKPLDFFIFEDNRVRPSLAEKEKALEEGEFLDDPTILKAPLNGSGMAYNPVGELLQLREEITTTTSDLRQTEDAVEQLNKQVKEDIQGEKVLTEEGFVFGGQEYKLSHFTDKPLEETYAAKPVTAKEVDLRKFFTPVKAQGEMGACTAFAMASIIEQIMKKNTGIDENLSEQFLYYHCRLKHNEVNVDSGSSLYDAIHVLNERGICTELLCPYSPSEFNEAPSEEAEKDAGLRRLVKAMNVERKLEDIKSALSEGYPVAISLRIPDGFGREPGGFVEFPSENVIAGIQGSHAMVICGYSDDAKFFILRNSWGPSFGDGGYCYVPYSYIKDTRLLNAAYIVTETSMGTPVGGVKVQTKVSFGGTNATIKRAIMINAMNEDRQKLENLLIKYKNLLKVHTQMVQKLKSGNSRNQMYVNSAKSIQDDIYELSKQIRRLQDERQAELNRLRMQNIYSCAVMGGVALLGIVWSILDLKYDWGHYYGGFILAGVAVLIIFIIAGYYSHRKKVTRKEYDDLINAISARKLDNEQYLSILQLKLHIYGEFLIKVSDFQQEVRMTYNKVCSLNRNLAMWEKELRQKLQRMHPDVKAPFIPILHNERLDEYFRENADEILKDVMLCSLLKNYQLTDESLVSLKKNLEMTINGKLEEQTAGFSIMEFLRMPERFPYLMANKVESLIPLMENQAMPFLHYSTDVTNPARPAMSTFINGDEGSLSWWRNTSNQYFTVMPATVKLQDPSKLVVLRLKQLRTL